MNQADIIRYLGSLPLDLNRRPQVIDSSADPISCTNQGVVLGGALLGFMPSVSTPLRQDLLLGLSIAQLAANTALNAYRSPNDWYQYYTRVLHNTGWIIKNSEFEPYRSSLRIFTLEQVIRERIPALLASAEQGVVKSIFRHLKKIPLTHPLRLRFEKASHDLHRGCMQLGIVLMEAARVKLVQLEIYFISRYRMAQLIGYGHKSAEIRCYQRARILLMEPVVAEGIRSAIVRRLGGEVRYEGIPF